MTDSRSQYWLSGLSVVVILLVIALGVVLYAQRTNKINADQLNILQTAQIVSLSGNAMYIPATIDAIGAKVYFPAIHVYVPLTDVSVLMMYAPTQISQYASSGAEITNHNVASYVSTTMQVRDCSSPVRIAFEPKPHPYNPQEIPAASVPLNDGRTLQVYAYHLATCKAEWQSTQTDPDVLAAIFKDAQSY